MRSVPTDFDRGEGQGYFIERAIPFPLVPGMPVAGKRLSNDLLTFVPKGAKVRPLRDQIFVEPLPYPSTLQVTGFKTLRGIVRAVGPGCYPKRYDGPKGRRTKSWLSKAFRPCDVQVGDVVELGGVEIGGYLFQSVKWGDKDCIICQEADIALILEN